MSEEALLIAQAIESLKAEPSVFGDYLFPLFSAFFSALLGAGIAFLTLRHQESSQLEREKLNAANKWIIAIEGLVSSLIAFKGNYAAEMTEDPIKRALGVRTLVSNDSPLSDNVAELSFITPKKEDLVSYDVKWRSLPRIRGMVNNYNLILQIVQQRNAIERPIKEALVRKYGDRGFVEVTHEQVLETIGGASLMSLVDLTEKLVHLIDDIILEGNSFLNEFPAVAKSVINTEKTRRYGRILEFSTNNNEFLENLMKKCPEVDHKMLGKLFGLTPEEAKDLYDNGYRWEEDAH